MLKKSKKYLKEEEEVTRPAKRKKTTKQILKQILNAQHAAKIWQKEDTIIAKRAVSNQNKFFLF